MASFSQRSSYALNANCLPKKHLGNESVFVDGLLVFTFRNLGPHLGMFVTDDELWKRKDVLLSHSQEPGEGVWLVR